VVAAAAAAVEASAERLVEIENRLRSLNFMEIIRVDLFCFLSFTFASNGQ